MLLVCLVGITYSNVYDMVFVYDDEFYIVKNQYLDSFKSVGTIFSTNSTAGSGFQDSFYRPIQFFSYLTIKQFLGGDTWGFHLLNVLIHIFNTLLLFSLTQLLGFRRSIAFWVAALWAAHPVHAEVIAYISGTADPLQCFFTLSALIVLLRKKSFYLWTSSLLFICALLSKEVAVVFPGLAASVLFLTNEKRWNYKTYLPVAIYLLLALTYVGLRATLLNFNGDFQFYKTENIYTQNILFRIYTFLATLPNYLALLFWPVHLHIDRAFPVYTGFFFRDVILGAIILLLQITSAIFFFLKRPSFGLFFIAMTMWLAASHSLHSGILVPMNSFFLEHWLYVPSMAVAWIFGAAALKDRTHFYHLVFALIVGALALTTYRQNRMWESPLTLFTTILKHNPAMTRARHNLAMTYSDLGQIDLAQAEYETILKDDANPYPQTLHNLGLIYLQKKQLDEGEKLLLRAIEISPKFHPSYDYLIQLYKFKGDLQKAQQWELKKSQL